MIRKHLLIVFAALVLTKTPAALAQFAGGDDVERSQKPKAKLISMTNSIDEYLESLPTEEDWNLILADFGVIQGNYSNSKTSDDTYQIPCLNQLDCICKEHAFGYSLAKYRHADHRLAEEIFAMSFSKKNKNAAYETFIRKMVIAWFVGHLSGKNLSESIKEAHALYKKKPKKANEKLDNLIDVNEVLNKKIESIKEENKKFVEYQGKFLFEKTRTMSATFQPFDLFWGIFALGYEWKVADWASFRARLSFLGSALITETYLGYRNKKDFSIFAGISSKMYVLGEALKYGFYLEPTIDIGYESVKYAKSATTHDIRELAVVPSLMVGFDKVFNSGIQLGVGMGLGGHLALWVSPKEVLETSERHFFVPKFYATAGYAW